MSDDDVRAALERHWKASDANDFDVEHQIYRADALLEYPQSGERIRGRHNIQASRAAQPYYVVSVMEFDAGEVIGETRYFGEAVELGPSRAQWVEK